MGKSVLTLRIVASLAGLALLAAAAPARAQDDSAVVEKITKLNKKAVDEFENLNFDQARKILKDALDACSRAGLDNSQVAARTHVHLGVVLFAGFKQKDDALAEFKKALEIAPEVKLDKLLATPEIQEVFDQAVSEQKGAGTEKESPPPSGDAITHEPVTRAAQGTPIQISATLDSALKPKKVVLSFSADGSEDFGEREMKEASPGNWMGEIPASATEGAKVSYYIEVDGEGDQVLATKGSAAAPLVVVLRGAVGLKPKAPPPPPKEKESEGPTWYFAFGLGSGFGWTTGQGEINKGNTMSVGKTGLPNDLPPGDKVSPGGFAWARLGQIAPEVGYFLSPDLMVSVQLRLQFVTGATPFYAVSTDTTTCGASMLCAAPSLAVAGFARAHYFLHLDDSDLHPFVAGMVGGGTIRHVATFNALPRCGLDMHTTCVDTITAGPVFVGVGGGIFYNLSPAFALTSEADMAAGFTNFTLNFDINVGVAVEY
ncbi:MAG TPA: tetratricopeptide repeat protein [Polyangia bacterium]|nr:tetratricopeptide repeat protein [Polyangia bacterium]